MLVVSSVLCQTYARIKDGPKCSKNPTLGSETPREFENALAHTSLQ